MEEEASEDQWKIVKQRSRGMSIRKSLIWRTGKKIVITGIVISSAPFVLPPLIIGSSIGFALSLPFGMLFVGYACTQKVMSMLLSGLTVERIEERGREEEEEEEEEEEFEEDVKRRLEMRIELVEDDGIGEGNRIGGSATSEDKSGRLEGEEEKENEGFVVEELVGVHDEEEVESLHGHGNGRGSEDEMVDGWGYEANVNKGFVEEEKRDEGIVGGVDEEEVENQQERDMTRVSEDGMECRDESTKRRGHEVGNHGEEDEKLGDVEEIVEEQRDEGIVAEAPVSGNNDKQGGENQLGGGIARVSEEVTESKEDYHVKEDGKLTNVDGVVKEEVKRDDEIVPEELVGGNNDGQELENHLGGGIARDCKERMEDADKKDDELADSGGIVKEEVNRDEGIVAEEPIGENSDEQEVEQLGVGVARGSEDMDGTMEGMGYKEENNVKKANKLDEVEGVVDEEEKQDERIVVKEPVGGEHKEDYNQLAEKDETIEKRGYKEDYNDKEGDKLTNMNGTDGEVKREEEIVPEEPVGGNNGQQEAENQLGGAIARSSDEGMEDIDGSTEKREFKEDHNAEEDKLADLDGTVNEEANRDEGIVAEEPVGENNDEQEVEQLGAGVARSSEEVEGVVEEEEKQDEMIVVKEPVGGEHKADHNQLAEKDETIEKRGYKEDYDVKDDGKLVDATRVLKEEKKEKSDEGIVVGADAGGANNEQKVENQLGYNITRCSGEDNMDEVIKGNNEKAVDAKKRKKYQKKKDKKNKKKREEGTGVEEPVRGNHVEQEAESQLGNGITMGSTKGMENKDEMIEGRDYKEYCDVKEADKPVDAGKEEEKRDAGIVKEEPVRTIDVEEAEELVKPVNGFVGDETIEEKEKPLERTSDSTEPVKENVGVTQAYGGRENAEKTMEEKEMEQNEYSDDHGAREKLQKQNKEEMEGDEVVEIPEEETVKNIKEETKSMGEPKGVPMEAREIYIDGRGNEVNDDIPTQGVLKGIDENRYKENGVSNAKLAHAQMEGKKMEDSMVVKEIPVVETTVLTEERNIGHEDSHVDKEIPVIEVREVKVVHEQTATSEQYNSETDETFDIKVSQTCVSRPVGVDAESQHESTAVSSVTEEHGSDVGEESVDSVMPRGLSEGAETQADSSTFEMQTGVPSKEVLYHEEKIWGLIDSMRKIVGYKKAKQSTFYEELRALYIFTGVEPPAPFKEPVDLVEVDDKLRLLMAIVGVK